MVGHLMGRRPDAFVLAGVLSHRRSSATRGVWPMVAAVEGRRVTGGLWEEEDE